MGRFFQELRRRKVFQVAGVYAVTAWLAAQALGLAVSAYAAPSWIMPITVTVLLVGFPVALILAWAFEVTPEGLTADSGGAKASSSAILYIVLAGVAGLTLFFLLPGSDPRIASPAIDTLPEVDVSKPVAGFGGRGAVAVLPFTNMSDDPGQEYFADGITEDIITSLQSWGVFPVISRNSTFVYKGQAVDVRTVGAELGVQYVLEGSVRTAGNRVRITAQLIDAETDTHLWAENYDRDMTDIFALQDEITEQIVTAIAPQITREEMSRVATLRPSDLEAYDLVLRAQTLIVGFADNVETANELISYLERALALDPGYALAHARLAETKHNMTNGLWREMGIEDPTTLIDEALEHAREAARLDPTLVDARIWVGHLLLHKGQIAEGVLELEAAVVLNPSHAQAHAELAHGYALSTRLDESLAQLAIASRLSPNDPRNDRILAFHAIGYYLAGRYEESAVIARRIITTWYGSLGNTAYAYIFEIASLVRLGRIDEARAAVEEYRSQFGEFDWESISVGSWGPGQFEQFRGDVGVVEFSE